MAGLGKEVDEIEVRLLVTDTRADVHLVIGSLDIDLSVDEASQLATMLFLAAHHAQELNQMPELLN
jgi:hypothetical protein